MKTCTVGGCDLPHKARGLCGTHYKAARKRGEIPPWIPDPAARFWSKVDKSGECWEWGGSKVRGYGQYQFDGRMQKAHRVSYQLLVGPIPEGLTLDHLCRNRGCVNPEHLEPVTMRENLMRSGNFVAVNAAKTHCSRGHEYTSENTATFNGKRQCKMCNTIRMREWRASKAASADSYRSGHGKGAGN